MAFTGKIYEFEKEENFGAFVDSLGMPPERAEFYKNFRPVHKVEKNGDVYTLTAQCPTETVSVSFKIGEEFDESLSASVARSKFTLDGNTLNQEQKFDNGCVINYKREYLGDKLKTTLTNSKWNGSAVRYYKLKA
ncbi:fatty acid-binding protein 2-like [Battus philenor]|uniref:fatty acid-binding protein 2-like n=1 Tax=Battus philenor TaxID=42288 RepID=UPI0035CF0D5A